MHSHLLIFLTMKKNVISRSSTATKASAKRKSVLPITQKSIPHAQAKQDSSRSPSVLKPVSNSSVSAPVKESVSESLVPTPVSISSVPAPVNQSVSESLVPTPVPISCDPVPVQDSPSEMECMSVPLAVDPPVCENADESGLPLLEPAGPSDTPVTSGEPQGVPTLVSTPPTPSQLDQPKNSNSEETFLSSRSYRSVVDKYTLGVHTVNRANIQLGVNSRVVTISGIMKVVNSFRAQGFIKGVNTPVVVFNTSDNRFDNIEVVRNSPELMAEIVTNGTLLCDAGQHREMALRYLEQPENKLPSDLAVPTHQEVEILLNVKDEYDFFVIGKKHNKVTQAQNNEHIIDQIKQVRKMWEKVKLMGGKRKQIVMADAFRLNCAEFGPEDMGATKFASYFAFYQTLSNDFMTSLENVTRKLGADPMPFKAIEVLVKKVKSPDMNRLPKLSPLLL